MRRCPPCCLAATLALLLLGSGRLRAADAFDHYLNPVLHRAPRTAFVKEIKELTQALIGDFDRVLPGVAGAFLLVKTNQDRNAKLLVLAARQKIPGTDRALPMILIERFVTYK